MTAVYHDPFLSEEDRRRRIYEGALLVLSPRASTLALTSWAREMIEEAFKPLDPVKAQYQLPVERFVEICAPLKPRFIHHLRTRALLQDVLEDLRFDLQATYLDVPRLRMVTSDGYLTSGVGYAHHPHRDTWYAAPMAQLNWWLPIWEMEAASGMAFHPHHWSHPVKNTSSEFNYYEWNAVGRATAAAHVKSDTRKQPKPIETPRLDPEVRLVVPPGGAILFSAAQLHSTVPNTTGRTRFSIDFRTVDLRDLEAGLSAPNIDSAPLGTSLRDFLRASDKQPLPEQVVAKYDTAPARDGVLVFRPGEPGVQKLAG